MTIEAKKLDAIIEKYNLKDAKTLQLNESALDINLKPIPDITEKLAKNIFDIVGSYT